MEHTAPFYFMALDVLRGVLERVGGLDEVSRYVVATVRELTGAKVVTLCALDGESPEAARLLGISPERKRTAYSATFGVRLRSAWRACGKPGMLRPTMIPDTQLAAMLVERVEHGVVVLPLAKSWGENGAIFLFDPPEREEHLVDVFRFMQPLQSLLGLVLDQAITLETQEKTIAERTRALARWETFYRMLFAGSPVAVALADPRTGRFQDVNGAFETLTGWSRADLVGQHHSIIHSKTAMKTADNMVLGFAEAQSTPEHHGADVIVTPDGNRREVEVRTRLLSDLDPPTMVGFFDDVTEKNRLMRDEKRLRDELYHAQKMEALGVLAGGVAHDFNNLLAGILGYSELALLNLADKEEVRENLGYVMQAAGRAKDVVRQILQFSRRSVEDLVAVDVGEVAREAVGLVRTGMPGDVTCVVDALPGAFALARASQVHQIVVNLCTNAQHAMAESGGTLKVEATTVGIVGDEELCDGRYVHLRVSDTGVGMNPETVARIFEPYFTTKPKGQGTGLGLAVVHGIVKAMGGVIRVRSAPGAGSSFSLLLPAHGKDPVPIQAAEALPGIAHVRILFVDDDESIRRLGQGMVESLGHQGVVASGGDEALRMVESNPYAFDLVITDQIMPGMDGAALTRCLHAIRPTLPVVIASGYGEILDDGKAQSSGAASFLPKPYTRHELSKTIALALKR